MGQQFIIGRAGTNDFVLEMGDSPRPDGKPLRTVTDPYAAQTWETFDAAVQAMIEAGLDETKFGVAERHVAFQQEVAAGRLRVTEQGYIVGLSDNLSTEQVDKIDEAAFDAIFEGCLQDRSYMRSIVTEYLHNMGRVERVCEIAGGEHVTTVELLGFDPTTGEDLAE